MRSASGAAGALEVSAALVVDGQATDARIGLCLLAALGEAAEQPLRVHVLAVECEGCAHLRENLVGRVGPLTQLLRLLHECLRARLVLRARKRRIGRSTWRRRRRR